jgi:uncharacterized membrane protein
MPDFENEPVWTFRGYQLRPSEFNTAMVHFFRAEISRANIWRQRLDTTTNWAVVSTGALISFSFSDPNSFSSVFILNMLLVTMFLSFEARRYRYYEIWSSRVRLMETDFFAAMLVPPFRPDPDWAESLAESLLHPHFSISIWEAFGRRLRRNYLWLFLILAIGWFVKLTLHPTSALSWQEVVQRAALGPIPGSFMVAFGVSYLMGLFVIALLTAGLHEASGEVLPRYGVSSEGLSKEIGDTTTRKWGAWFRPSRHRQQLLAFIITDNGRQVADFVMENMKRGITSVPGTGMYTGKTHSVLMCALTVTEVGKFKALVRSVDVNAFVIVTPAQEIFGKGFTALHADQKYG